MSQKFKNISEIKNGEMRQGEELTDREKKHKNF